MSWSQGRSWLVGRKSSYRGRYRVPAQRSITRARDGVRAKQSDPAALLLHATMIKQKRNHQQARCWDSKGRESVAVALGAVEALPEVGVTLDGLALVEHHREDELARLQQKQKRRETRPYAMQLVNCLLFLCNML